MKISELAKLAGSYYKLSKVSGLSIQRLTQRVKKDPDAELHPLYVDGLRYRKPEWFTSSAEHKQHEAQE